MTRLVGAKLYPGKQERNLAIKESGQGAEIDFKGSRRCELSWGWGLFL
jgi:hypothetical protein